MSEPGAAQRSPPAVAQQSVERYCHGRHYWYRCLESTTAAMRTAAFAMQQFCLVMLMGVVRSNDECPCQKRSGGHFMTCNSCCSVTAPGPLSTLSLVQLPPASAHYPLPELTVLCLSSLSSASAHCPLQMEHDTAQTVVMVFAEQGFSQKQINWQQTRGRRPVVSGAHSGIEHQASLSSLTGELLQQPSCFTFTTELLPSLPSLTQRSRYHHADSVHE